MSPLVELLEHPRTIDSPEPAEIPATTPRPTRTFRQIRSLSGTIREILPPDAGVPGPPEGDGGSAGTQKSGIPADEGPVRREAREKPQEQSVDDGSGTVAM